MPLYEFFCSSCQSKFEELRPFSRANEPAACPACHNGAQRMLSTFASFSKGANGEISSVGAGSGCSGCAGGSCATCH